MQAFGKGQSEANSSEKKELEKIATEAKIATLARRVANLPEGVPAEAFYDEMKRLNEAKTRLAVELIDLKRTNATQAVVAPTQYERLLAKLNAAIEEGGEISPDTKRRIIQALVQEIKVTRSGFRLRFFAGVEQIKAGEALASPASSLEKKNSVAGSFLGLNGGGSGLLVEPLVVSVKYRLQWVRPKVDLVELAKLRRDGWSITRLSEHFGKPRSTICRKLKLL